MFLSFKELSKTRKIFFSIIVISSSISLFLGIIIKEYMAILFALLMFIEALSIGNDQFNDDIIEEYKKMLQDCQDNEKKNYLEISKAIKNNDKKLLNDFCKAVDDFYKEE